MKRKSRGKPFLENSDVLHSPFISPPCGRPTEAACWAVSQGSSAPAGSERNNGRVWLMGERNSRQSFISMSYYHTVCSLTHSSLSLNHILPTLVHSDSSFPTPTRLLTFNSHTHTHTHQCISMSDRERDLWTKWKIFLKAMNVYQVDQWKAVKSFSEL